MTPPPATLLGLMWLASPALPVGGFSYSEGLEAAVEVDADEPPFRVQDRAAGVSPRRVGVVEDRDGHLPEPRVDEAAELAGATTESLLRLAKEYEERARTAMKVLTAIATVLVMFVVFGVLIFAIFWLFFNLYMKPINEALEWSQSGQP